MLACFACYYCQHCNLIETHYTSHAHHFPTQVNFKLSNITTNTTNMTPNRVRSQPRVRSHALNNFPRLLALTSHGVMRAAIVYAVHDMLCVCVLKSSAVFSLSS